MVLSFRIFKNFNRKQIFDTKYSPHTRTLNSDNIQTLEVRIQDKLIRFSQSNIGYHHGPKF